RSESLHSYTRLFISCFCLPGIAKACEQNLRKTLQYGGRSEYPSAMELKAMVAGRSSKRQLFLLSGGIERHLKIKTCSVAFDVIEEVCIEMGLHKDEAFNEYAIFAVTNRGERDNPSEGSLGAAEGTSQGLSYAPTSHGEHDPGWMFRIRGE
ncbi:hypothetical protein FKM82_026061, partial [Ascaphus truei]